jgi:Proteins containing SET domain
MDTEKTFEEFVVVKESSIHGKGLFTSAFIPQGSKIMIIEGEVISEEECIRREDEENNVYIFWNGDTYIDTVNTDKIKYINHSCNYTCSVIERDEQSLYLTAYRDLSPDEELTIDYGYEEIYDYCNCKECRPENYENNENKKK